jgi:hypothetical protein
MGTPGTRKLHGVFTKDKHGTVIMVGMFGKYWSASDEAKLQRGWGFSTAIIEIENNKRYEIAMSRLSWTDPGH